MSHHSLASRLHRVLHRGAVLAAAGIAAALLAACGGGGSSSGSSPPNASVGPNASSVVSSDNKVTLAVGDNALQQAVSIAIAPATPDAATAAEPSYVAGTTYSYAAPDIQVPEQVLITIESPLAVTAEAASSAGQALASGLKRALALPPGYQPPPTCLVNAPSVLAGTQTARNILVTTTPPAQAQCPQAPAPGCVVVFQPNDAVAVCAPSRDVILAPSVADSCPAGYREVTGEAAFAELAAANGFARVCLRSGNNTPPVLRNAGGTVLGNCLARNGQFVCAAPRLPSGVYSVYWDKEPPPEPLLSVKSVADGTFVFKDELETGAVYRARVIATDPHGLGAVEILEIIDWPRNLLATGTSRVERVWAAPASAFSGAAVTTYDSGSFALPFENADLAPGETGQVKRRFIVRSFDKAGNSSLSNPVKALDFFVGRIAVEGFSASTPSVQFPGGPVTLSWSVKGATRVSIDNGGGVVVVPDDPFAATPGQVTVNVTGTTTFTLSATHPNRTTKTATVTVTLGADATPPTVSLAASPATVVAPGSTTLTATASDNAGVSQVEFYRGATLIGTDTTAPFTQPVSFTPADIGGVGFTAKAYDAAGNSTTSAVLTVNVGADVTPPAVTLSANPATVLVPGSTTLLASATDNIGVTKVEFFRGATLVATVNSPPFQTGVDFTAADLGTATFTAKAYDAQDNSTTSAPVNVLVSTPAAGDTYASPSGVDAGNSSCSQANPCLTIAKAAALAQANKTVWLMNGDYTDATQPAVIALPAGLTLRALTPGAAAVGQGIALQGSGSVVGVVLRRLSVGGMGYLQASAGTVTLEGVKVIGAVSGPSGTPPPLELSGSVHATMTPGNLTDYADQLSPAGQASAVYARLSGSARLTVAGGQFGGAALGGADPVSGSIGRGAFVLQGSSRLDLTNVVLGVDSAGVSMMGGATQLFMTGSLIVANANTGNGAGIHAALGTPQISLVNSSITGFRDAYSSSSRGILVGTFAQPGAAATVNVNAAGVSSNNLGIQVTNNASSPSSLTMSGSLTVSANTHGGIVCEDACSVDLSGGEVSDNGSGTSGLSNNFYGGVWMGQAAKTYQLKLRNMMVVDNRSAAGGNAAAISNSGVTMAGNAASSWDLGTAVSPGNNTFLGHTSSAQTTGLNVEVAAGLTASAVGNTFAPGVQGASAQGKYTLGTAPCGASACNVTSGAGANYRVGSGTLRLAQ